MNRGSQLGPFDLDWLLWIGQLTRKLVVQTYLLQLARGWATDVMSDDPANGKTVVRQQVKQGGAEDNTNGLFWATRSTEPDSSKTQRTFFSCLNLRQNRSTRLTPMIITPKANCQLFQYMWKSN